MKASLLEVFLLMKVECINSKISSSFMCYPTDLSPFLNSSKSMAPSSFLSRRAKTLLSPSLVLTSPTDPAAISTNSSNLMDLLAYLSLLRIPVTSGFLLSTPNSSSTLLISTASMVPLPSASNTSKVALSSS